MKKTNLTFVMIIMMVFLHGCHKKQEKTGDAILNDILHLQQAQINSFDPLDAYHIYHVQLVKQIYNTLTDLDSNGKIVPSLAESWETKDGKEWNLKLREGVYFGEDNCFKMKNERLLIAEDIKYTFERLLSPDSKSLGISYFSNLDGFDEYRNGESKFLSGILVKDDLNVSFILKKADFTFPNLLSLPYSSIVKKRAVDFYGSDFKMDPVGTGPFRLSRFVANQMIELSKNKDYWEMENGRKLPLLEKVNIQLITDDNLAFLNFKNQKIDFLELNIATQQQLEKTRIPFDYKTDSIIWTQLNFYLINLERIKDPNIRLGINYAINREELQKIIRDQGKVTHSLFPSIFKNLSIPNPILSYQPEKAEKLISKKMNLKLVCFEDMLSRAIADLLARNLKNYSIELKIESVTFPVLVDRLIKGDYDVIQLYWGPFYADVGHFLNPFRTESFPPSGNNFNKYSNPDFDDLLNDAPGLPSSQRKENYLKSQEIILNDMPFFLAYYKNLIRVSNKKFTMPLHPLGYRFYKLAREI